MTKKTLAELGLVVWVLAAACASDGSTNDAQGAGSGGSISGSAATTGGVGGTAGSAASSAGGGAGTATSPTGGTSAGSGGVAGTVASSGSGDDSGVGGTGSADPDAAVTTGPRLLPTDDVTMDGPYATMVDENADNGAGWVFRPTELGANGEKHPILVWGCGSTSMPSAYMFHLSRVASHGFVVYASISSSVTGALLTQGLDFMFAENDRTDSDLYQKLDLDHVAVGGHSLGSLSTYDIAGDPRITNTIHVDGGQFDGMGGQRLVKPAIFICGDDSIGKPNCDADYMGASVPIFYTQLAGLSGLEGHIQAAREGIDIWVAWMRWTLAGEEERRADFLEPNCTFCTGKYTSMHKNFN